MKRVEGRLIHLESGNALIALGVSAEGGQRMRV
jgi:hypothetical protein